MEHYLTEAACRSTGGPNEGLEGIHNTQLREDPNEGTNTPENPKLHP